MCAAGNQPGIQLVIAERAAWSCSTRADPRRQGTTVRAAEVTMQVVEHVECTTAAWAWLDTAGPSCSACAGLVPRGCGLYERREQCLACCTCCGGCLRSGWATPVKPMPIRYSGRHGDRGILTCFVVLCVASWCTQPRQEAVQVQVRRRSQPARGTHVSITLCHLASGG